MRELLQQNAELLVKAFQHHSEPAWAWFEDKITYDSAAIAHALFVAAEAFESVPVANCKT